MRQFSAVERFATKLQIMSFMSGFDEVVKMVKPQIDTVSVASKSLRNSAKLKKVLELILALGNYMNSAKKGPCYGFKLQSLDSLTITKSTDKKQHLVHYLNDLVLSRYPELKGFEGELKFIEKAAQFSLENILTGNFYLCFLSFDYFYLWKWKIKSKDFMKKIRIFAGKLRITQITIFYLFNFSNFLLLLFFFSL